MLNTTEKRESIMTERYAIAVDLDGTLAHYDGWKGISHIGNPIPEMVAKIHAAHMEGKEIWIFTARLSDPSEAPEAMESIKMWLDHYEIPFAGMTATKHKFFKEFWDDRAITIVKNTGLSIEETLEAQAKLPEPIQLNVAPSELQEEVASLDEQVGGSHYTGMTIQPVEYAYYNRLPSIESSVVRYVSRHEEKNGEQDIDKAIDLLHKLKEMRYSKRGVNSLMKRIQEIETK